MDENKATNGANEQKRPAPPPIVPKKEPEFKKGDNKKLLALIPIIAIVVIAVIVAITMAIKNGNKDITNGDATTVEGTTIGGVVATENYVIVTDENGDTVTDANGVPVTENRGITVKDENGKEITVTYKAVKNSKGESVKDINGNPVTVVHQVVTDAKGVPVKDANGKPLTIAYQVVTDKKGVPVTDAKGKLVTVVYEVAKDENKVLAIDKYEKPVDIILQAINDETGGNVKDKTEQATKASSLNVFFKFPFKVTAKAYVLANDIPSTVTYKVVRDGNGEPVTDKNGKPVIIVYQVVTDENGDPVTDANGETLTIANQVVEKAKGEPVTGADGKEVTVAYQAIKDGNGDPVTDEKGEPVIVVFQVCTSAKIVKNVKGETVTAVKQTEVHKYTDKDGEEQTTIVHKEEIVVVPESDENSETDADKKGETTTDKKGESTTAEEEKTTIKPDGTIIVGTTAIPVTDGQGNTAVDNQGNIFTTLVELTSVPSVVKPVDIEWKNSIGGTVADYVSSVETLKNGAYITATVTNSVDGDFSKFKELGYSKPYTVLTKYSKNGEAVWQIAIGSKRGVTTITDIVATDDGGFYAVGYGKNIGGVNGKGYYDGTVYKFDKKGEQEWNKIFGTSTVDIFKGGALSKDGGIIVAGSVGNNDMDVKEFKRPALESAAAIVKYNSDGSLAWKNVVGGDKDSFTGVAEDIEGNVFCVGNFYSGELFKNRGSSDGGIVKFTSAGEFVQATCIGGTGVDSFNGITACKTGGIVVVGKSNSSDAGTIESSFVDDLASRGGYDSYIFKYNSDLTLSFSKALRGQNNDDLTCVIETEDGDLIVAGSSNSATRDFKGVTTRGGDDIVIACFDKFGDLSWVRSFGGTKDESANAICLGIDGGYLVVGKTLSKDIDMKGIAQYVTDKSVGVIVKFPE